MSEDAQWVADAPPTLREVAPDDAAHAAAYATWRSRLGDVLGHPTAHVGSTAVPGLAGRPVVDVLVQVPEERALEGEEQLRALESLGLVLAARLPGRCLLVPTDPRARVHVHLCAVGSEAERELLLLRDFLRAHAEHRDAYQDLLGALTGAPDERTYVAGKDAFLAGTLWLADEWAVARDWSTRL